MTDRLVAEAMRRTPSPKLRPWLTAVAVTFAPEASMLPDACETIRDTCPGVRGVPDMDRGPPKFIAARPSAFSCSALANRS